MRGFIIMGMATSLVLTSTEVNAQTVAEKMHSLHAVLDSLFEEMLPLCEGLIGVGQGIAGFAALFFIGYRVWRHIANAEPVDFFPLFRPFALGFCIAFFPLIVQVILGIMSPVTEATAEMVQNSDKAIELLLRKKELAVKNSAVWQMYVGENKEGNQEKWLRYTQNIKEGEEITEDGWFDGIRNDVRFAMAKASYNFRNSIKEVLNEVLEILFQAASLCINTLRTFQLVVLAILGPLVFGMSVFDGFQNSLSAWLSRFINVYLWLPVCHVFGAIIGKIQERMLLLDLDQINANGDTFFSAQDTGYLVFLLIGIVGYFTVPTVAGFIVNSGGNGMMQKVSSLATAGASMAGGMIGGAAGAIAGGAASQAMRGMDNIADMGKHINEGYSGKESGAGMAGAIGRSLGKNATVAEKISDGFSLNKGDKGKSGDNKK